MRNKPLTLIASASVAILMMSASGIAQDIPAGYPESYAETIAAATAEGRLSIYSNTDAVEVQDLLAAFQARYPGIQVEYSEQNSTEIYSRFIGEAAANTGTADILWSSAMDLQMKLVADGYVATYETPEAPNVAEWANWENQAFGITAEPILFAYNARLVDPEDVPTTHQEFVDLMTSQAATYDGKVTSYDPEKSGAGYLYMAQDEIANPEVTWALAEAVGANHIKVYTSTGAMIERLISGEHLVAYNINGPYVIQRQKVDPNLGYVMPTDYTLLVSRVAVIPKAAQHPNAAKLFIDFLLSSEGQSHLATRSMPPVRNDMADQYETIAPGLTQENARPIPLDMDLLNTLDQTKRLELLGRWQEALKG